MSPQYEHHLPPSVAGTGTQAGLGNSGRPSRQRSQRRPWAGVAAFFTCAGVLLPTGLAAAAPPASAHRAVLPCEATLRQLIADALFSGPAGQRLFGAAAVQPGSLLSPATGAATPQAAATRQGDAKTAMAQCAFETEAYPAAGLAIVVAFLNFGPQGKAAEKKLEDLPLAKKKALENAILKSMAPGPGSNPLASIPGLTKTETTTPSPKILSETVTAVKVTKRSRDRATIAVTAVYDEVEIMNGRPKRLKLTETIPGVEAWRIGARWFITGEQGLSPPKHQH